MVSLLPMRASRLLTILLLLQNRGRATAQELATELEVSVRTVYRDVEALAAAGVPVVAGRGPAGGYHLVDGYRTRLTGLTVDEAETLFLAGAPGPVAELGLGEVLAAAELKLLAALPTELRARAGRLRERFHLDAPGWFRDGERPEHLAAIADAVWNARTLRVRYRRWGGEVARTLEPLGIVLKGGSWYLVARVSGQARVYRVSRILELEALGERFERPERFDLAAFWQSYSERFETSVYHGEATVRLSPRALTLLPYFFQPVAARTAKERAGPSGEDGWVRTVIPIESPKHAHHEMLRLGAEVEVLAPEELRRRMAETAEALVGMYGAHGGGGGAPRRPTAGMLNGNEAR